MRTCLFLVLCIGVACALRAPRNICTCNSDTVMYEMSLKNPQDNGLCRFGCMFLDCMKKCKLPGEYELQKAINAQCTADKIIVSVLCLVLPVLQALL